jgi:hypothetical protein
MGAGLAVGLALDGADAAFLLVEGRGDGADLGEGACSKDNALGAALGDGRAAVGDIEPVTGAGVVVENRSLALADRQGFTGEQSFVGLEVLRLNQPV